ncbi:MAG TPA: hypothetical protein VGB02_18070 [Pyrinomonadaceae bacterium]|jgi:hypothetical protein
MNKYLSASLKFFWFAATFLLLALPVFIPSFGGLINVINICLLAMILLSFPCNILVLPFFSLPDFHHSVSINLLYTQLIICSVISYYQWFVLFPRLVKYGRKLNERKHQAASAANFSQLEPPTEIWQKNWYDEKKRTPVERIFEDKNE